MKIPINFGAGGGSGSDDCTAEAADVLEGKTAIYNGTDDEPEEGGMADYSDTTSSAPVSIDAGNSRLQLTVPYTGKYDTDAKLYSTYSQVRTLVGYTDASKVLSGTTILGLAGTMADRSGTTSSASSSLDSSNSRVRLQIPTTGYYNTSSYLYATYSNIASLIGLTAAKIKYGETILGVTGTWNGYVATATDLYYGGATGSVGGSITTYPTSTMTITLDTSCITCSHSSSGSTTAGFKFNTGVNCGAYSSITMTLQVVTPPSTSTTGNAYVAVGIFSSSPTSASDFAVGSALAYATRDLAGTSAGSTYTTTLSISSISQTAYVGVCLRSNSGTNYLFDVNITRIQLS